MTLVDRFWSKVDRLGIDECWLWQGAIDKDGYGKITIGSRTYRAHRVAYELHTGLVDEGMFILHHCDNPTCCNPYHLFQGTNRDNIEDMLKKGRSLIGSKHHKSKLSEEDIPIIRNLYKSGVPMNLLAEKYKVDAGNIHHIVNRNTWKHVL